ncbi:MAG: hypothetical protein GEU82_08995 [Luteitalea sp.]|nr:hypothetical protein [Luteitalea sp.]
MRESLTVALVLAALTGVVPSEQIAAQSAKDAAGTWTPSKTAWGDPDLQGIWNNATSTPLERPGRFADKPVLSDEEAFALAEEARRQRDSAPRPGDPGTYNAFWSDSDRSIVTARTSLIIDPPDGRIPALTPQARRREMARAEVRHGRGPADSHEDRNRWERCLARGLPMAPGPYNNTYRIFQVPGSVVILMEMIHDVRVIPLDGRPHGPLRRWLGDSRGRWEGNTLVVETVNFADKLDGNPHLPSHRGAMFQHSGSGETLRLVERFTRVSADTIDYEFTMDDPQTFTRPWTALVPMARTDDQLYEYACHEGNYGLANILTGARADDAAGMRNLGGGSWTAGRSEAR